MKYFKIILFVIFTGCCFNAVAQKKVTPAASSNRIKLKTVLGDFKDSVTVSVEAASNVIGMPLNITDQKNNVYSIKSYQFLYKKVGVTEDEQTEKTSPTTSISSSFFQSTPLPPVWVSTIQKFLKSGEEFYFFDVVVKDSKGNYLLAPTLKICIR